MLFLKQQITTLRGSTQQATECIIDNSQTWPRKRIFIKLRMTAHILQEINRDTDRKIINGKINLNSELWGTVISLVVFKEGGKEKNWSQENYGKTS